MKKRQQLAEPHIVVSKHLAESLWVMLAVKQYCSFLVCLLLKLNFFHNWTFFFVNDVTCHVLSNHKNGKLLGEARSSLASWSATLIAGILCVTPQPQNKSQKVTMYSQQENVYKQVLSFTAGLYVCKSDCDKVSALPAMNLMAVHR